MKDHHEKLFIICLIMLIILILTSCDEYRELERRHKHNIDSVEVVATNGDTVIIFGGNYTNIKKK